MIEKPSRELDALVAARVLQRPASQNALYDPSREGAYPDEWCFVDGGPLPFYSTEIEAAWEVIEWFRERGAVTLTESESGAWQVDFDVGVFAFKGRATTAPHAICIAALRTVGAFVT